MLEPAKSTPSFGLWVPTPGWPRYVAAVWLAACVAVLCFSLWSYAPGPRSDAMVLFAWAMLALSFPAGLLVSLALAVALQVIDTSAALQWIQLPTWMGVSLVWLFFCLAGYTQWFVLVPRVQRRFRPSQAGDTREAGRVGQR